MMTKVQALKRFRAEHIPYLIRTYGKNDKPAIREAWNNWIDSLCKDGDITLHQYNTWINPF